MALSFLPSNTPSTSPIIECIDMKGWVDVDVIVTNCLCNHQHQPFLVDVGGLALILK